MLRGASKRIARCTSNDTPFWRSQQVNVRRTNRRLAYLAVVIVLVLLGVVAIGVAIAAHNGRTEDVLGGIAFLMAADLLIRGGRQ